VFLRKKVDALAKSFSIHLRVGCFCNIGACAENLCLSDNEIINNYQAGHICGDKVDLVNGLPIGAIRISFGYISTLSDVEHFINFIQNNFKDNQSSQHYSSKNDALLHSILKEYSYNSCISERLSNQVDPISIDYSPVSTSMNKDLVSSFDEMGFDTESNCVLKQIVIYPVKSCAGCEVTAWRIGETGLQFDRFWMITTTEGRMLNQNNESRLALIKPTIDLENGFLTLEYEDAVWHVAAE